MLMGGDLIPRGRGRVEPERLAAPQRYPDPAIQVLDPGFERYCIGNAAVERIATGMR
jgi:hypothetical protein